MSEFLKLVQSGKLDKRLKKEVKNRHPLWSDKVINDYIEMLKSNEFIQEVKNAFNTH